MRRNTAVGAGLLKVALVSLAILLASTRSQGQQAIGPFEGILTIVWGDPHPQRGSPGETRYSLTLADGSRLPLQLTGLESEAAYYFGKRVVVSGRPAPSTAAAVGAKAASGIIADSITLATNAVAATAMAVSGTRKVIYLLLKFADDTDVPHPPVFFTNLTNPDTPPAGELFPATINGFYKKTSSDQFSWIGSVGGMGGIGAPGGWLTLPQSKDYYAPCDFAASCANLDAIANDGMSLGRAQGITFTDYDNINFVLNNDLDCCAWGGSHFSPVDNKTYGATWAAPWAQETFTYVHELGHSIGLPHSGWVYYAYDSPWDTMSAQFTLNDVNCGSYFSINDSAQADLVCREPGSGLIASYKDFLGWIPTINQVITDNSSSVTVTLEGVALPIGSAIKMIKICLTGIACSGPTARYFTVEARTKGLGATSQYDNAIVSEGIVIHEFLGNRSPIGGACFVNDQSGWAVPVDPTPNDFDFANCDEGGRVFPDFALYNSQWHVGQTYLNSSYGFGVQVLSKSGSTYVVSVGSSKKRRGQVSSQ